MLFVTEEEVKVDVVVDLVPVVGITLRDESTTAVSTEPPAVVGQAPVGCTPGGDFLRGQEDDGDQDDQEHEELEHFRCCVLSLEVNEQ